MPNLFSVSGRARESLKKLCAGLLMLSLNLSVGGVAALFTSNIAQAVTSTTTLFNDGFESNTAFYAWTASSDWSENSSDKHSGNKSAQVKTPTVGTSTLKTSTSTLGYTSIVLDYWYKIADELDSTDRFAAQWSSDGGLTWTDITGTVFTLKQKAITGCTFKTLLCLAVRQTTRTLHYVFPQNL